MVTVLLLLAGQLPYVNLAEEGHSWIGKPFPATSSLEAIAQAPLKQEGGIILFDFWASWCPPCKASFPAMDRIAKDYAGKGVKIIAVNEDEKRKHMERFLQRQPVSFAIAHDTGNQLIKSLKVKTMPTAFLVDANGIIRSVHEGFHGKKSESAYRKAIEALLNQE